MTSHDSLARWNILNSVPDSRCRYDTVISMLWTVPNILTLVRLVLAPAIAIVFLVFERPYADWFALAVFLLAAFTDYLDGYLARLWKQESGFGKMLDPVADKAMVIIALSVLVALSHLSFLVTLPAVIIMFREVFVSGLREFVGARADALQVTAMAKWKTTLQMLAIAGLFLATGTHERRVPQGADDTTLPSAESVFAVFELTATTGNASFLFAVSGLILLWFSATVTLYTGWNYLVKSIPFVAGGSK